MSHKKITAVILVAIITVFMLLVCFFCSWQTSYSVFAEEYATESTESEINEPTTPTTPETTENGSMGEETGKAEEGVNIEALAEQFKQYLIERYGEDYEYYYNKIIDNWGSVEAYLLAFGEKLPEEHKNSWQIFVGWLSENAPIWATPLAIAIVIIVVLVGKKKFKVIVEKITNSKLSPVAKELSAQSNANVAIMRSLKALMGTNEKFSENVKELEASEKELTGNE